MEAIPRHLPLDDDLKCNETIDFNIVVKMDRPLSP
jgi:hypothetical protein